MRFNPKKKIIIVSVIILVTMGILFTIVKFPSTENVEKQQTQKKDSAEDSDIKKSNNKNNSSNQEEITMNEEYSGEKENGSSNENFVSSDNSSSGYNKSTIDENRSNTSQNSTTTNNTTSSVIQQPQSSPPQTEWERFGISEYAYYNTPMNDGEEVAFTGDISVCTAEINRLVNTYYKDGLSGGNSYSINGKYTHSYIGCGINIFINGVKYKYSQVKAMGYK